MKTNQTMLLALFGAVMCSFFFGLGQHEAPAATGKIGGTGVQNCVNSCCENIYCWWNATNVLSAENTSASGPPFKPGDNTTTAIASVYVQATTPGGCKVVSSGSNYDQWSWQTSTATCENSDGTYPVPQPVTPSGSASFFAAFVPQTQCGS